MTLFLVMLVLGILSVAAVSALNLSTQALRQAGNARLGLQNRYCAETGLGLAREHFLKNPALWSTYLQTGFVLRGATGVDLPEYSAHLEDNLDELPPLSNDPKRDSDGTVILIATCEVPDRPVSEKAFLSLKTIDESRRGFVFSTTDNRADPLPKYIAGVGSLLGAARIAPSAGPAFQNALILPAGGQGASIFLDDPSMNGDAGLEVSLYVRADPAQLPNATLVSKSHGAKSADTGWSVELDGGGQRALFLIYTSVHPKGVAVHTSSPLNDGRWHHLAGRYDGRTLAIYLDGVLQQALSASGKIRTNSGPLSVGRWELGPSRHFSGALSGLVIRSFADGATFQGVDGGMAVLFGGPKVNQVAAPLASGLPVLTLNGVDQRALLADAPNLAADKGFELDLYLQASSTQNTSAEIVAKAGGSAGGYRLGFWGGSGLLAFSVTRQTGEVVEVLSQKALNDGLWHHVRALYVPDGGDGVGEVRLFVDHLFQGREKVVGALLPNDRPVSIGAGSSQLGRHFRGHLAGLLIRGHQQRSLLLRDGDGALSLAASATVVSGRRGQALSFDGSGRAVAWLSDTFFLRPQSDLGGPSGPSGIDISLWLSASVTQVPSATVFSKGHGAANLDTGYSLEFDSAGQHLLFSAFGAGFGPTGLAQVRSARPLNDGNWHHVRCVQDGSRLVLFVDGVLAGRTLASGPIKINSRPLTVGRWELGPSRGFAGLIEDLRVNPLRSPGDGTSFVVDPHFVGAPSGFDLLGGKVLAADLNGDGSQDLVQLGTFDQVRVFTSQHNGTFGISAFRPWAGYGISNGSFVVADLNGDGREDLVHLVQSDYVHPWISKGDGTFAISTFRPWPGYGIGSGTFVVADLNGDGRKDLVHLVAGDYLHSWISDGAGGFAVGTYRPWVGYPMGQGTFFVGDLDGDGREDLVHLAPPETAYSLLSLGDGRFRVVPFRPWAGYSVAAGRFVKGDFNGDRLLDLVHLVHDYVHTWYGNGDGTFSVGMYRPWAGYNTATGSVLVGDLDEDHRDDLIHTVPGTNYLHTWMSTGDHRFVVGTMSPWPGYAMGVGSFVFGQWNRDGKVDLLHLWATDRMNVYRGRP